MIFNHWDMETRGDFTLSEMSSQTITDMDFSVLKHFPEEAETNWRSVEWAQSFWWVRDYLTVNGFSSAKTIFGIVITRIRFSNCIFLEAFFPLWLLIKVGFSLFCRLTSREHRHISLRSSLLRMKYPHWSICITTVFHADH